MQFNSWQFAVFLPVVFFLYYGLNERYRWLLLLAASYFFYMSWNPWMVVLLLATTAVTYWSAVRIGKTEKQGEKRFWLFSGLLVCLGILFFFKYFDFFAETVTDVLCLSGVRVRDVALQISLPVGISFYTFQTLGYVIDVYRGKIAPEHHIGYYALFVTFFPQLVAGPISRAGSLLPQMREQNEFSYEGVVKGMELMAWGYFKKLVIAASLSVYVDKIYEDVTSYAGFALLVVAVFYSIQIYCDFSGYSDIAIGCARMFGKDLMINFKSPYYASGIKEFWGRWHISLSTWFRDYVYIPLGGNRVSKFRHEINLMITFLVSGLWHGADWTFVIWGGIHGIFQVAESLFGKRKSSHVVVRTGITFLLVTFAWIFFRADTLADAVYVITHMFQNIRYFIPYLREGYDFLGLTKMKLLGLLLPIALLAVFDYCSLTMDVIDRIHAMRAWKRWVIYVAFVSATICFVEASYGNVSQEFIYFQF